MRKNKLTKFYLYIAVATFISIIVVITQQSYSNLMGPVKTAQGSSLTKAISGQLSTNVIDDIIRRQEFTSAELNLPIVTPVASATPTISVSP